jgi:hypothetical protein
MATINRLVRTKDLKMTLFEKLSKNQQLPLNFNYDPEFDSLILLFVDPNKETIVHYVDDHIALLYEPTSKEVVGIQVEAFQKAFIKQYDSVARVWKLQENCEEINDLGDLVLAFERQKPQVSNEVFRVTNDILHQGGRSGRHSLVPA